MNRYQGLVGQNQKKKKLILRELLLLKSQTALLAFCQCLSSANALRVQIRPLSKPNYAMTRSRANLFVVPCCSMVHRPIIPYSCGEY